MQDAWSLGAPGRSGTAGAAEQLDEFASRAARGDRSAFEAIYFALVDELHAYARSQCGTDVDADDIVANVFLRAWQYGRRYRVGSQNYRAWMYGIARNEIRNHWRRQLHMGSLPDRYDLAEASSSEPDTDRARARLRAAIARLTPDQREVIVLRYFNDRSHAEIGMIMGKREGSIRALQHRALRQLQKAVRDAAP